MDANNLIVEECIRVVVIVAGIKVNGRKGVSLSLSRLYPVCVAAAAKAKCQSMSTVAVDFKRTQCFATGCAFRLLPPTPPNRT